MKKVVKERMLQLLITLLEAHEEVLHYVQQEEKVKAVNILADCQDCAILIGNTIEEFETDGKITSGLEAYCEELFHISGSLDGIDKPDIYEIKRKLDGYIKNAYDQIEKISASLKVVFFPYQASMWTSLESIWRAADEDEECEAKVVVIPYYVLDQYGNKKEFVYEASLFPQEVLVTHYKEYSVEKEQPDIIFIHNPYDDRNSLTRVPKEYYSYYLKQHTEMLVYSPYCMMGYHAPDRIPYMCYTNGVCIADKILVQSEKVKQIYMDHKVKEEKLIALGSPKVDAIVNGLKMQLTYPPEWRERLGGKKVFLLNTHLAYFESWHMYCEKDPALKNYAIYYHERIFDEILGRSDCALIWRPHPLLKAQMKSKGLLSEMEFIAQCEQRIAESDNAVIDRNGKYDMAFRLSDALITTYSSMIPEYMISGKPVCIYQCRMNLENCKNSPVDYTNNYYMAEPRDGNKLSEFVQMVLEGKDYLYEERMADVHRAFANLDGTIGKEIYRELKNTIYEQE